MILLEVVLSSTVLNNFLPIPFKNLNNVKILILQNVKEELADVMIYCIHMANALDVNIEDIINMKMDKNEMKYPVEKAKGKNTKYTEL